jgi:hypothetical protein
MTGLFQKSEVVFFLVPMLLPFRYRDREKFLLSGGTPIAAGAIPKGCRSNSLQKPTKETKISESESYSET